MLKTIPLDLIDDKAYNCRGHIQALDVEELARDISKNGLVQPVTVCPDGEKYRLIAGFRRTLAHKILGKTEILCIVRLEPLTEVEARFINLSENMNRSDLDLDQEAKAIESLIQLGVKREVIAERVGKSPGWVQIRGMYLALPEDIRVEVKAGYIKQTNIRALYTILGTGNTDALYAAVRKFKDAKDKGVSADKANAQVLAKPRESKRARSRNEISDMVGRLLDSFGPSFATRALAWAAGNVSDEELQDFAVRDCGGRIKESTNGEL
jgi:ParB/RepB/Spo0J family partition protein